MIRATSRTAYYDTVLPTLTKRQDAVLKVIQHHRGITINECALAMGTTPNVISGRFGELERKLNVIYRDGRRDGGYIWKARELNPQMRLI
jgi:hypothetical protein